MARGSVFDNGGYIGRKGTFGEAISVPQPITSGLRLYLDAANASSYPGTGTTWFDLSGVGNNGTLTNGPTYSSTAKTFTFDGTDDYVTLASPSSLPVGTSDRTVQVFVRTPSSWSQYLTHAVHWGSNTTGNAFGLAVRNDGLLNTHPWGYYDGQGTVAVNTNYSLAVSYTGSSSLHKFWINGVSQGAGVTYSINTGTAQARVGSRIYDGEDWGPSGVIHLVLVYNRVLTDAEILQNHNSFKSRLGL